MHLMFDMILFLLAIFLMVSSIGVGIAAYFLWRFVGMMGEDEDE